MRHCPHFQEGAESRYAVGQDDKELKSWLQGPSAEALQSAVNVFVVDEDSCARQLISVAGNRPQWLRAYVP